MKVERLKICKLLDQLDEDVRLAWVFSVLAIEHEKYKEQLLTQLDMAQAEIKTIKKELKKLD